MIFAVFSMNLVFLICFGQKKDKCPKNDNRQNFPMKLDFFFDILFPNFIFFKSRMWETKHFSTDADSSTDTIKILNWLTL